ncbi:hypothetical protein ACFP81_04355 [Deinococcus lacus]|uniref:Uncharacterized protein n=1 Tax=Deinococcus lacus TaxID=392561 RepID=A0ABW1YAT3_9DEIO
MTVETSEGGQVILIRYVSQPSDRDHAALAESCVRQRKDSYKVVSCVAYSSAELLSYRQTNGERPCWQVWAYSEHHKVIVHPDNVALNLLPPCGGWVQLP